MTRQDKLVLHNGYGSRVQGIVESTGYFADATAKLVVRFGRPNIARFSIKTGSAKEKARKRGISLTLPFNWEEMVWKEGLAIVETGGDKIFILSSSRLDDVGNCPVYSVQYAYYANFRTPYIAEGFVLKFGGRMWFSSHSPANAFEIVCRAVEVGLTASDEELPF